MKYGKNGEAQWWEAAALGCAVRAKFTLTQTAQSTRLGSRSKLSIRGTFRSHTAKTLLDAHKTSRWAGVFGLRSGALRKKIIGHRMRSIAARWGARKHVRGASGAFPLLEKPAGQHGGGVFLHPLIDQRGDFLAEIRGVRQTRQFKALQGVARSREKELPRRLSRADSHRASCKGVKETKRILADK